MRKRSEARYNKKTWACECYQKDGNFVKEKRRMRWTLAVPYKKVSIFINSRVPFFIPITKVSKDTIIEAPYFCQLHLIAMPHSPCALNYKLT